MPNKQNRKGRSRWDGRHVRLPHFMLESEAWRSLSSSARSAYVAVAMIYNGRNNGYIAASALRVGEHMGVAKTTAARALLELVAKGFLEVTATSAFNMKQALATEYRLTLHHCDRTGDPPSKAFQRWRPAQKTEHGVKSEPIGSACVTVDL